MNEKLDGILDNLDLHLRGAQTEAELRQNTAPIFSELDASLSAGPSGEAFREFVNGFNIMVDSKKRNPDARSFAAGLDLLRRRAGSIEERGQLVEMEAKQIREQREREEARERSFRTLAR